MNIYEIKQALTTYPKENVSDIIFMLSLKPKQLEVFSNIPKGLQNAISCSSIKSITGIETKNISSIINELGKKYPIHCITIKRKKQYYI